MTDFQQEHGRFDHMTWQEATAIAELHARLAENAETVWLKGMPSTTNYCSTQGGSTQSRNSPMHDDLIRHIRGGYYVDRYYGGSDSLRQVLDRRARGNPELTYERQVLLAMMEERRRAA